MKLLSSVLLIVAFESLFANYASSQCQSLNRTLFNDSCISAGYNMSEFSGSRPQGELASLITSMQSKFENCSASFSTLMACSVHVPKCSSASSARLPCKEVCRNFVRGCQHGASENEGLVALFRGLCELLPSDQCLPKSNPFNNTGAINITCQSLDIPQCKYAGYSLTSVSSSYQKMVESSKIFQSSHVNSTLRKIICMEVAPPCDNQNNRTLRVPCKSTCHAAFNESTSQFLAVFKSPDYCSVFPQNKPMDGQEYCSLQAWPGAGYWPSDLWRSIGSSPTAPGSVSTPVPTTKAPLTTPVPTTKAPVSTSAPTTEASGNVSSPVPTTKAPVTSPVPTTTAPGNVSTPVPTTTAPGNVSTPVTTTSAPGNVSTPVTTTTAPGNVSTPVTTTTAPGNVSTPVTTTTAPGNVSMPVPTTTAPGNVSTPVTTTSAPGNVSTPVTTTTAPGNVSMPVTTTTAPGNVSTPVTTTTAPGNVSTPVTTTEAPGNVSTPVPTTTASGNVTTHVTTTATHAVSDTTGKVSSTENHSSTSGMSSTTESGTKGSSDVQAKKGGKLSAGAISGIVLGVIVGLVAIAVVVILFRRYKRRRNQYSHSLMVNMDEL